MTVPNNALMEKKYGKVRCCRGDGSAKVMSDWALPVEDGRSNFGGVIPHSMPWRAANFSENPADQLPPVCPATSLHAQRLPVSSGDGCFWARRIPQPSGHIRSYPGSCCLTARGDLPETLRQNATCNTVQATSDACQQCGTEIHHDAPESITTTVVSPVDEDELCAQTLSPDASQCPICAPERCDWVRNFWELSDRSRLAKLERTGGVTLSVTVVNGEHETPSICLDRLM